MKREVWLLSYLPAFLAEYKETAAALQAADPEFALVWEAADKVLYNAFIATADEYGIARFERLLGILPSGMDTLASRRNRVQARWFMALPGTWRMFLKRLTVLCGNTDFTFVKRFDKYRIELYVSLELFGQVEELNRLVDAMLPCNMVFYCENRISCRAAGSVLPAGGTCALEYFFLTNDGRDTTVAEGAALQGGGATGAVEIEITDNFDR